MNTTLRCLSLGVLASSLAAALAVSAAQPASGPRLKKMPTTTGQAVPVSDRFIVRYANGTAAYASNGTGLSQAKAAAARTMAKLRPLGKAGTTTPVLTHVRRTGTGAQVLRVSRRLNAAESAEFLVQLRADASVKYAQVDGFKRRMDVVPNDPYFSQLQWDFTDPGSGVGASQAWDTSAGEGVVVAVLDTGVLRHSDLAANLVAGYDMISAYGQTVDGVVYPDVAGDGNGRDPDPTDPGDWTDSSMDSWCGMQGSSSWHGTHVAGTVAAVANNALGIAGLAYRAKVQPVRVLGHCGGSTSDIVDGIVWASGGMVPGVPANANPAEVLNLSLGGYGMCSDDPATQEAIDGAIARGTTVVVAAGNNTDDAQYYSPASCKGVITVGATGVNGAQSWFSNFGPAITLSAPGGNATSGSSPNNAWIWSLGDSGTTTARNDNAFVGMIGTSQAAPHVAAVVAMMQAAAVANGKPPLTPATAKRVLRATTKPFLVAPSASRLAGAGILDAHAAVLAATQDIDPDAPEPLSNRVATTGLAGGAGDDLLYSLIVPAGRTSLNIRTYGGSGDVSLYVSRGTKPTTTVYERKSAKAGNAEAVVVTRPAAGTWYVRVVGETAFANVSALATH